MNPLLAAGVMLLLPVVAAGSVVSGAAGVTFKSASSGHNSITNSLQITVPAGVTSTDLLLAGIDVIGSPTITAPSGWQLIRRDTSSAGTHLEQSLYMHVVTGSEPSSYTWAFSASDAASGGIADYGGVDTSNPVDASSGQSSVKSAQIVGPSLSASATGDMLVGRFGYADIGAIAAPAGMTQRFSDTSSNHPGQRVTSELADQTLSSAGATGSRTVNLTQPDGGIGALVALRHASTPPTPPAQLTQTANTGTTITLGWQASIDNVGVAGYAVYQNGTLLANAVNTTYTVSGLSCGSSYDLAVSAYDASGNYSGQTSIIGSTTACVIAPPSVGVTAPNDGATVSGAQVTVSASATATAGIASVQFQLDGNSLGAPVTTAPYSLMWDSTTAANGPHVLTAVATDANGTSSTSAPVNVAVINGLTNPPVVDSVSINQTAPTTNQILTATVTAHDPAGASLTYSYQWLNDGVAISGATGPSLDLSQPANGNKGDAISLQVTASDGQLTSSPLTSNAVTIVNSPPAVTVSLSSATPDTDATITATASPSDADGDPVTLTYVWSVNGTPVQSTTSTSSATDSLDLSLPGHGNYGDTVSVMVTPNDGTVSGAAASATATITKPQTGTVIEYPVSASGVPSGLTSGPDGNLWFTLEQNSSVGQITPAGAMTLFPVPTPGNLGGINPGPDGNLWFTEYNGNKIGRITPSGSVTEFPLGGSPAGLGGIVAGADGNMWFATVTSNTIGKITTSGVITQYTIPTANALPHGLNLGPDGNVWFTEFNGDKIAKITPSGTITEYKLPTAAARPDVIVAGPDGNMWFTEDVGKIGRITTSGALTEFPLSNRSAWPVGISVGPDGNLWFTEKTADKIGRITPNGVITEFPVPTAVAQPDKIVSGPDGNLWFTEHTGDKIARITP